MDFTSEAESETPVVLYLLLLCFFPLVFVFEIPSFLLCLFMPPPHHHHHHSFPPAHLLKSASTKSVPLGPAHITAFMKERFLRPCRILYLFLSWGLTIINSQKMGSLLKGGKVILYCKLKCFKKQDSFVESRAII